MYHELARAGISARETSPGYLRYVLQEGEFRTQLDAIAAAGWRGEALSAALVALTGPTVLAITFDDGCATDLEIAAGLLAARGFGATFFVVPGFLGKPGHLTRAGVRQLADAGYEIGSHSMQHRFLPALSEPDLLEDLKGSRLELEDLSGRPVTLLSCPGGRWSPAVAHAARTAGYHGVATSRIAVIRPGGDPFRLGRVPIRRGLSAAKFRRWCEGRGLAAARWRGAALTAIRGVLGDDVYHRLHRSLAR